MAGNLGHFDVYHPVFEGRKDMTDCCKLNHCPAAGQASLSKVVANNAFAMSSAVQRHDNRSILKSASVG